MAICPPNVEFENGPSSFSTLHFLPDFITELMNENEIEEYKQKNKLCKLNDSDQDIYIPQGYQSIATRRNIKVEYTLYLI